MLIRLLRSDLALERYFCDTCSENGIAINIDNTISCDDILIIRVDNYYNHLVQDPECSPDCLIIQRCGDLAYKIYIVELKNIDSPDGFSIKNVYEKYITCLDDFMSNRFGNYFHNSLFTYLDIRLIFVTDPYNFRQFPLRQTYMRGYRLDVLMAQRIPRFFNRHLFIEHKLPDPTIRPC